MKTKSTIRPRRIFTLAILFCLASGFKFLTICHAQAALPLATPADYRYPVPSPEPALPSGTDTYTPPLLGSASGPAIAEWIRSGNPNDTIALAGPSFTSLTYFHFFGQTTGRFCEFDRPINIADSVGTSVTLPSALPAWSMYLLWPVNGRIYGMPVAINRTEAWWVGPDQGIPGDTVYVYGRNLSKNNSTDISSVYIKPVGSFAGEYATVTSVNPYRVGFQVPSLPADTYEIWIHNNHGGHFGWSGPLTFTVLEASPFAGQSDSIYNVANYGAIGDGSTDDTAAIQRALSTAAAHAPATVYFPTGTYIVNAQLSPSNNVSWLGDGRDSSFIKVGPKFYATGAIAFIFSQDSSVNHIEFKNLTIDGNGNLGPGNNQISWLIWLNNHDYLRFTNARLNFKQRAFSNSTSYGLGQELESNTHFSMSNTIVIGAGLFFGTASQVSIDRSRFVLTDRSCAAIISWGGSQFSVTNTTAQDYDDSTDTTANAGERFFLSQGNFVSLSNFYIAGNRTIHIGPIPADPDQNAGEQILFEVGWIDYSLSPVSATSNTVTFLTSPTGEAGEDAFIVEGRGAGQARHVVSVSGNTITLDTPWRVEPDTTSLINIGPGQSYTVIYNNTLNGKADWGSRETASIGVEMYGDCWNNIIDENIITQVRSGLGEYALSDAGSGVSPSYFDLVTNNTIDGAFDGLYLHEPSYGSAGYAGSIGHMGDTYRYNSLSNIMEYSVDMGCQEPDGVSYSVAGDFEHEVLEHNHAANGPQVPQQEYVFMDYSTGFTENHADTGLRFLSTVLYDNTFDRSTGPFAGSTAFKVPNDGVETFLRASDRWLNFQNTTTDPNSVPPFTGGYSRD